jgi:hypothetical protein
MRALDRLVLSGRNLLLLAFPFSARATGERARHRWRNTLAVALPSDASAERNAVAAVVSEINQALGVDRGLRIGVTRVAQIRKSSTLRYANGSDRCAKRILHMIKERIPQILALRFVPFGCFFHVVFATGRGTTLIVMILTTTH